MKRLVLWGLVLLIGLFVAGQSFVSTAKGAVDIASTAEELRIAETVKSGEEAATPKVKAGKVKDANVTGAGEKAAKIGSSSEGVGEANMGDVNMPGADVNVAREPNEENLKAGMSEDLEKAFAEVKRGGQKEGREWMRFDAEQRMGLAKAIQSQVLDELNVLRGIAVEEKAIKTTAAIDILIADRKERYEKVLNRMESEDEKARRQKQLRDERGRDKEPRRNERPVRSKELPPKRETGTGTN
jgi:hypothetical protein